MTKEKIDFTLANFIQEDYFAERTDRYMLEETSDTGQSELTLSVNGYNLCVKDFDTKPKCNFVRQDKRYGMRKSVDHLLFRDNEGHWELHLIEMKTFKFQR